MGCCSCTNNAPPSFLYVKKLQEAIDRNNLSLLNTIRQEIAKEKSKIDIDEPFIRIQNINMNPLAYAFWFGRFNAFIHLYKKMNASLSAMENLYLQQGKHPLNVLFMNGNLDILEYYLPIYLEKESLEVICEGNGLEKLANEFYPEKKTCLTSTPIHLACEGGNIHIINYIYKYFKDKSKIPYILDIHYQNPNTGENCALIACRKGNFTMVKYLHEICKVNFRVINTRYENALIITATASKKRPFHNYHDIFAYLINEIKLDISYMYEEILLLLENKTMIELFENELCKMGIVITKEEVDKKNRSLKNTMQGISCDDKNYNFKECQGIREVFDNSYSDFSTGEPRDSLK
ncbi:hypothetical protein SteCoe_14595 [Stentor coeruleus]|uniref:Uncharacterized protein n=1 Tax=Stentor coeruleus TaxID=5963 RepID=A0A1R2C5R2_9CILI|nr:hypothetical protein SteCoe_14595 [Stentor coeruleus]